MIKNLLKWGRYQGSLINFLFSWRSAQSKYLEIFFFLKRGSNFKVLRFQKYPYCIFKWPLFLKSCITNFIQCIQRVSHETWQLVNNFENLLPNTVLDVTVLLKFISLKNLFPKYIFEINLSITVILTLIIYFN